MSKDIHPSMAGQKVKLLGWVEIKRDLGKIKFIILRDYKGRLQVTFPPDVSKELTDTFNRLGREDVISISGIVKNMPQAPKGVEILPEEIKIINKSISPLPLELTGKVKVELDTRLDNRILDLRTARSNAIFKINNVVLTAVRNFFVENEFIEIHTPKIIASATEGGTELFPVAYFDKEAFLAQSPQLYKEQLTSVFEKVYEIAPVFRAEESNTTRHLSEIVMLDVEAAFTDYDDIMNLCERLLDQVFAEVISKCSEELAALKQKLTRPKIPYKRYTYSEVIEILSNNGVEIKWGDDIDTLALRKLGELLKEPYFIKDWPTEGKPFYIAPRSDKPEISESFDLMCGWLEIASGGTRIHQKDLLINRIREKGMRPESFDFHIKTFDWGMPPHAGCGIGLARLLMALTGLDNIREAVLFPRDRYRLTP
ncbi:MAG: aspartate--tRNA(Asn) ligase [Candidatus Odinarchaeota archaeon]